MNTTDAKRVLETALICSQQPLALREMRVLFNDELGADTLKALLVQLQDDWTQRGVELVQVASGWRFQSRPQMREYLDRLHPEKPPKYTRAVLETLAIIAYRQPVTRGDMEEIRGVTINTQILKQLEDRGWIEAIGHREAPGRPALYATTKQFLDDLGIESLDQLPMLESPAQQAELMASLAPPDESVQPELAIETPADAEPSNGPETALTSDE
jgi:segregation and condensation protein B